MLEIASEPIDPLGLIAAVRSDACGALVTFFGVVRETSAHDARRVLRIRYEAYSALALKQFYEITQSARAAFGPLEIAIVHRTGDLELGEASIGIAVAAPHRGAAFDACEFVIDEIKRLAAVWKQEVFADGETAWQANGVVSSS